MKRRSCLTLLMVFCLMTTLTGYAFAAQFTDTKGHWAESQITKWADSGLASGYANSTFKPNGQVTRAEFVALVNRAFNINKATTGATDFKDVKTGNWFYADVMAAKAAGYTGGYSNGTFKPNQTITRQEVASILTRLLSLSPASTNLDQFKDAQSIQNWAQASVGAVVNSGLMGGYTDSTFKPLKSITRAEAVVSLDRAMGYQPGTVVTNSAIAGKVSFMGSGIANATVKVFTADGYDVLQTATTDKNGSYKLNLAAGKYDLTATTSDRVAYQSDVTVNASQVATVNMTMDSAAVVKGNLKDKNNNLLKNCTMYFTTNPTFVTTTNSSGNFTLPVLANHVYSVRALDPSKTDEAPVEVNGALNVGASGSHDVGTLNAPFAIKSSVGGGGGGSSSSGGGGTIVPSYPTIATLPALLDAVQDAFNNLSPTQWASLKAHRDTLLSISDDKIVSSLQSYGLAEPFENVINTNITADQAKTTLSIIRSLSYLGQGNVSSSLSLISSKVTELKHIYSAEISKLTAKGVTQQQVFNYGLDLYSGILNGQYTIHSSSYEEDLYDAAFDVLKNGNHTTLYSVAKLAFDKTKTYYTSKPGSFIGMLITSLEINGIDDIKGSYIINIESYAETKAETNSQVQELLDFAKFIKDFSQDFVPVS